MAKSPIVVVWASTTSNKDTLDTTTQGNGIVFESDIVSDFINSALYINSQATRNLQVMGGYYDGGQEYKNYQYCSQIVYDGSEYVLNYYMATKDNPTLTPTNATSNQQGTTDMEIPINPTQVQTGWRQLNTVPNQANIAYKNKANTFTASQTFNQPVYFNSTANLNGNTTIGDSSSDTLTVNSRACFTYSYTYFAPSASTSQSVPFGYFSRDSSTAWFSVYGDGTTTSRLAIGASSSSYTPSGGVAGCPYIYWYFGGNNYMNFISRSGIIFYRSVTIQNASFGTASYALDPEWEQDYATANYVNQKLQELYDYLDARLTTIESKVGITSAKSKAKTVDARAMINNIAVPKSKLAELLDRLENLEGYEGVLGYSNAEERMELSKARDSEESIMQIMDSIKARIEKEAKEREAQEAQQNQEKE